MIATILHSLKHALMISAFVLSMMLLIEYITIRTKNKFLTIISKNEWWQVIIAAFLGIIPGCLGTFFAVSLYSHKVLNFPALVTVLIATSGDEAFVMLGEIPKEALILNLILFFVAIAVGFILNIFLKKTNFTVLKNNMLHQHENAPQCICFNKNQFKKDWSNLSFERALLVFFSALVMFFILFTAIETNKWGFENITMLFILSIVLFIVITVPEHFLTEHLWKHTIKRHLFRIFLWTLGALLLINILLPYLHITQESFKPLAQNYYLLILLVAVLVGIIPESGPNLVFVFLFAQGYIPLSILLANSISQDGHGSLPLLAESQKSFLYSKAINIFIGFLAGLAGYFIGF